MQTQVRFEGGGGLAELSTHPPLPTNGGASSTADPVRPRNFLKRHGLKGEELKGKFKILAGKGRGYGHLGGVCTSWGK